MTFRRRTVLLAAGAVAAAVMIASVVVYVATRDELRGQLDASLRQKLTPGKPQAVQVKSARVSAAALRQERVRLARALKRLATTPPPAGVGDEVHTSSVAGAHPAGAQVKGASGPAPSQEVFTLQAPSVDLLKALRTARGGGKTGQNLFRESVTVGPVGDLGLFAPGPDALAGNAAIFGSKQGGPGAKATVVTVALPAQKLGGATGYAQLVQPNGQVLRSDAAGPSLPVTAATRAVAAGRRRAFFSDASIGGTKVRVLTERAALGTGVWQVALPLADVNSTLGRLKLILVLVCLGGIALAAGLGLLVSRAALVPVRRLTGAAERVAQTDDLGHRIQAGEADELGRLAVSFNKMLAALERSRLAQRQLVSDASHELRTPLTSIRANLDALAAGASLPVSERTRVIGAVRDQLQELTVLVGDLVDLSNTGVDHAELEDVRLDLAVAGALDRARLHAPQCSLQLDCEPCLVRAAPRRLDRAIANLLDNACKWNPPSPPAPAVEVRVRDGCLQVRDHGPGISAEDLPHVFDRFYRAPDARAMPGSGLGLAIVRDVAATHGGSVQAENAADGGARLTLKLPNVPMSAAESAEQADALSDANALPGDRALQQVPPIL
ncbi:MAG: HAMP domain-containing sensor histidine kinase [Solirubrobacteraceae bacterium]